MDPAFTVIYAASKAGKTTSTLYDFPCGLFIADLGALGPAEVVCGYTLRQDQVRRARTIKDAAEVVRAVDSCRYDAVVIDDFTIMAEYTVREIEKKYAGWDVWKILRSRIFDLRDAARNAGVHVVLTAHEVPPETKGGRFYRGGPKLPIRGASAELPALADLVMRVGRDDSRIGWKGVFECRPNDNDWVMGSRLVDGTTERLPMNTREILNATEKFPPVRRLAALPWQEDAVSRIAAKLAALAGAEWSPFLAQASAQLRKNTTDPLHIRWTLRDAVDRAELRCARRQALSLFGIDSGGNSAPRSTEQVL